MTRLTPRQVKAQQTKKKLLETALALFSQKGFDNVTVDEIVAASQTSKGAFYVHFKSKYEVFLEKFKEIDNFYETFIQSLPVDIQASEKLLRLTESQMVYLRDCLGKDMLRTVYMNALVPNPDNYFTNTDRPLYKIVHSFAVEGQETGEFTRELSAMEITMLVTRCMRGSLYDWCMFEDFDLVAEASKFMRIALRGLTTPDGGKPSGKQRNPVSLKQG